MLLRVQNITVHYKRAIALDNVSLDIAAGTIATIIGANGAGKSTLLSALSGLVQLTSGEIWFDNKRIDRIAAYDIVKLGLVLVPEGRRLFPYLTVMENLRLGACLRKDKKGINADIEKVSSYFPRLKERFSQKAGSMSGGEQQMLAIARGLMAKPRMLMLDEPSLGLSPLVVDEVGSIIKNIHESGVTVLLVEQNVSLALRVAASGYVMRVGRVILTGTVQELKGNEVLNQAYLGG
ncbi:MAG: ABC transporter ATP-binding protein [Syntrophorhabdales bacterium]|jgi:branched-chain amino acid transport system ATP-binding protein